MKRNDIERIIAKLPAADGNLTPQQHIGANIWLARSSSGSVQIVLSSAEPPSKTLMLRRARLDQGINFLSEENSDIEGFNNVEDRSECLDRIKSVKAKKGSKTSLEDEVIFNFYQQDIIKENIDQNKVSKIFKNLKI